MENIKHTLMNDMRQGRLKATSAYLQFVQYKEFFDSMAFCFYEGEDAKYYCPRLYRYLEKEPMNIEVGSKQEVLKTMRLIRDKKIYDNVCTMYFIDNDFDKEVSKGDEDLFVTPCHSIENFYANEECFKKILINEFGLNCADEDFKKCVDIFISRFKEFNELILKFNALMIYQYYMNKDLRLNINNVTTSKLLEITLDNVKKKTYYDEFFNKYIEQDKDLSQGISLIEEKLRKQKNIESFLRGKNQLDFMVSIIQLLLEKKKNSTFFSKKLKRVYLNITKNKLSELSQYAITPKELQIFIQKHNN